MGALGREGLDDRRADGAGPAGDDGDLSGERFRLGAGQLRLFQRPVFEIEEIGTADRLETADGSGVACGLDPHLADIDGNGRILEGPAMAEHAEAVHQRQTRHGIEHGALDDVAGVVAAEIFGVIGGECGDMLVDDRAVTGKIVLGRCRQHHRASLDADGKTGRGHATCCHVVDFNRVDEVENGRRRTEHTDHAVVAAFALSTATAPRSMAAMSAGLPAKRAGRPA